MPPPAWPSKPLAGMRNKDAACDALPIKDLAPVEAVIAKKLKVPISAHENDALQSLGFNIGTGGSAGRR